MPLRCWSGPALIIAVLVLALPGGAVAAPGDLDGGFAVERAVRRCVPTTFPGNDDARRRRHRRATCTSRRRSRRRPGAGPRGPSTSSGSRRRARSTRATGRAGPPPLRSAANTYLAGLAIDEQHLVVLAGVVANANVMVGRLTTAGQPDPDFNGSGFVVTALNGTTAALPEGLAIDQGGGVLVGSTVVVEAHRVGPADLAVQDRRVARHGLRLRRDDRVRVGGPAARSDRRGARGRRVRNQAAQLRRVGPHQARRRRHTGSELRRRRCR